MPEFDLDAALQPPPKRYTVEFNFLDRWDDAGWTESDGDEPARLMTFDSEEAAWKEIEDHVQECREAMWRGDLDSVSSLEDYRVVPVREEAHV